MIWTELRIFFNHSTSIMQQVNEQVGEFWIGVSDSVFSCNHWSILWVFPCSFMTSWGEGKSLHMIGASLENTMMSEWCHRKDTADSTQKLCFSLSLLKYSSNILFKGYCTFLDVFPNIILKNRNDVSLLLFFSYMNSSPAEATFASKFTKVEPSVNLHFRSHWLEIELDVNNGCLGCFHVMSQ